MATALVVLAHPLKPSLADHLAHVAMHALLAAGHTATLLDLAAADFDPRLSAVERANHYEVHDSSAVAREAALLEAAEILVLVFPTWWFLPPALMKGFFDRVFAPGVAFDQAPDLGAIRPRLLRLRRTIIVTTLGSPWWIDWLLLWRPLRSIIKWGIIRPCAPRSSLNFLALYSAENAEPRRITDFARKLTKVLSRP